MEFMYLFLFQMGHFHLNFVSSTMEVDDVRCFYRYGSPNLFIGIVQAYF
ncbi:hypothetical protein SAMN03080602_02675 [Arenibacter troitsensis]|uniref:Uncharacterized protein n=1 Tax=Arenibacter troitsensis TaxID=188872 RepID=A0A1X7KBJ3_9FLAO|nr:hypothetical protein SAMN03080602_02675 [Arenibacter troitsensis]